MCSENTYGSFNSQYIDLHIINLSNVSLPASFSLFISYVPLFMSSQPNDTDVSMHSLSFVTLLFLQTQI